MDVEDVFPETVAGPACDETAVVPDLAITAAEELAWSEAAEYDEAPAHEPWRTTFGAAAFLLVAGLAIAGLVVWAHHDWAMSRRPIMQAAPVLTSPSPTKATTARPTTAVALPTGTVDTKKPLTQAVDEQDAVYVAELERSGIVVINRAQATMGGRSICIALQRGHSEREVADLIGKSNTTLTAGLAASTVSAAETAYCPEQRAGE